MDLILFILCSNTRLKYISFGIGCGIECPRRVFGAALSAALGSMPLSFGIVLDRSGGSRDRVE
jgi:hypothetical protein